MVTTRRLAVPLMALSLLVPSLGRAHIAKLEAVLDTRQEIPGPVGANAGAGTGQFVLEEDGSVEATVTYQGLTGAPMNAEIRQGDAGIPGSIPLTDFTSTLAGLGTSGTIAGTGSVALSEELQQVLLAGGMYFNIHTRQNPNGEIRGQIYVTPGPCSCDTAANPGSFKRCVKQAIRSIDEKAERREESVKKLRRLVAKSACGKTKPAARKQITCCLPFSPAQNIVTDRLCATLKAAQCANLGGTSLGVSIACMPNPCRVGSPSGAFVETPASD